VSRADAARSDRVDASHVRGRSRLGRTFRTASRRGSGSDREDLGTTARGVVHGVIGKIRVTCTECYLYTCVCVYV
jgi:hypothetical protein